MNGSDRWDEVAPLFQPLVTIDGGTRVDVNTMLRDGFCVEERVPASCPLSVDREALLRLKRHQDHLRLALPRHNIWLDADTHARVYRLSVQPQGDTDVLAGRLFYDALHDVLLGSRRYGRRRAGAKGR